PKKTESPASLQGLQTHLTYPKLKLFINNRDHNDAPHANDGHAPCARRIPHAQYNPRLPILWRLSKA
ncbi:MAG: hypothetical protein ABJA76_10740, partial [Mucilaginibacter sp.]